MLPALPEDVVCGVPGVTQEVLLALPALRVPSGLAAVKNGEMAGVTCSPPCRDALQVERGLWAAFGLASEVT